MAIDNGLQKCNVWVTEAEDRIFIWEGKVQLTFTRLDKNLSEGPINEKSYWPRKQAKNK